ncbi:MAG: DUF4369 domain-containing protein, partial [Bacteroidetes bacterium]|nr:DUF4369 domain-containing protein [Bacteroidota bacterium]
MKLNRIFTVVLLLLAAFTVQAQHNIEFKINGLNRGEECILAHYYADQNKIIDTAVVNPSGKVVFKGPDKLKNGVYIIVLPKHTYIEFVVPNDDQTFAIEFDTSLASASKNAIGSMDNQAFFEFDKYAAEQGIKMRSLRDQKKVAEEAKN